jgi:hypothetical protein
MLPEKNEENHKKVSNVSWPLDPDVKSGHSQCEAALLIQPQCLVCVNMTTALSLMISRNKALINIFLN